MVNKYRQARKIDEELTLFHRIQTRTLPLHDLLQILQIRIQPLDLILVELRRFRRSLSSHQPPISPSPLQIQSQGRKTHLLNIKPRPDINQNLPPFRQMALNIQRARQRNKNLILAFRPPLLGPDHPVVDGAHAVAEFGLRGSQLGVRGG